MVKTRRQLSKSETFKEFIELPNPLPNRITIRNIRKQKPKNNIRNRQSQKKTSIPTIRLKSKDSEEIEEEEEDDDEVISNDDISEEKSMSLDNDKIIDKLKVFNHKNLKMKNSVIERNENGLITYTNTELYKNNKKIVTRILADKNNKIIKKTRKYENKISVNSENEDNSDSNNKSDDSDDSEIRTVPNSRNNLKNNYSHYVGNKNRINPQQKKENFIKTINLDSSNIDIQPNVNNLLNYVNNALSPNNQRGNNNLNSNSNNPYYPIIVVMSNNNDNKSKKNNANNEYDDSSSNDANNNYNQLKNSIDDLDSKINDIQDNLGRINRNNDSVNNKLERVNNLLNRLLRNNNVNDNNNNDNNSNNIRRASNRLDSDSDDSDEDDMDVSNNDNSDSDEIILPETKLIDITKLHEENKKCVICIEDFKNEDTISNLPCAHIFHIDCIKRWMRYRRICPICRLNVRG